jgi:hypothetical protein
MFKQLDKPNTSQHSEEHSHGSVHSKYLPNDRTHQRFAKVLKDHGGSFTNNTAASDGGRIHTFSVPKANHKKFKEGAAKHGFTYHYSLGESSQHAEEHSHGEYRNATSNSSHNLHQLIKQHGGSVGDYSKKDSRKFKVPLANQEAFHKAASSAGYTHGKHYHLGTSSQHSEESQPKPVLPPVSFVNPSPGSLGPAIQFRETGAEQFNENEVKALSDRAIKSSHYAHEQHGTIKSREGRRYTSGHHQIAAEHNEEASEAFKKAGNSIMAKIHAEKAKSHREIVTKALVE